MSTAYSSAKQKYIGNGVTTEWGFDFPIQKHSELKVYLKRSSLPQVLLEEGVDYSFVTENTIAFPIKTGEAKLQATDVLALQRESVFESEYNFSNQQRLEPEEVMHADDNLERQIQELKRDSESAIKVQPTSNINTDEYFIAVESIYENLDNITNVSGISAEIVNCSDNISDISTVSSNIANVNAVGQSISNVNTVASNVSSVNTVAGVSTDVTAVASIASSVTTVAANDANVTTVATNISDVNTAASNMAAIKNAPTAAANAAQSAANAANSATDSANSATASATSANNSHIWAEGTDAQVQAIGGVHSSRVWAEQSTNANISLTNSPYTTNRILEIPQDIKLELNNGTLTLKAGSKVYVPNGKNADGSNKFDEVVIESDISLTQSWGSSQTFLLFYDTNGLSLRIYDTGRCYSGTTSVSDGAYYNTNDNKLYVYDGGSLNYTSSLPIAIITGQSPSITSIDQIFNGFGYIGSTVFALPWVKVQIPNGRNEDGTCMSIITTVNSVKTGTITDSVTGSKYWYLSSDLNLISSSTISFDADKNTYVTSSGAVSTIEIARSYLTSGKITSFEPYTVDSIVNSNASNFSQAGRSYLSGLGMPSNRYIDLTLGASGSTYTAPANGWFYLQMIYAAEKYVDIWNSTSNTGCIMSSASSGSALRAFAPCRKGDIIVVNYSATTKEVFKFVYAEGEV